MAPTTTVTDAGDSDTRLLAVNGRLTIAHLASVAPTIRAMKPDGRPLTIDLGGTERIDTSGAWLVHRLLREWKEAGSAATVAHATPAAMLLIDEVAANDTICDIRPAIEHPILQRLDQMGRAVVEAINTLGEFLAFLGKTIIVLGQTLLERRSLRWHAVVHQMETVGVNALGIVGIMLFLVGLVVAQQGAVQLRQFGADIFVVNLIGRSVTRELGVLLTAIMVAGRSGSAFAAQIGSMKLAQEIDAMETIGMSPIEVLVIPRMLAMGLMMFLLGFFGSVMAILGGGLYCWLAMGISPASFAARLQEVVPIEDVLIGLIKAPVFGVLIAVTGCFQGMQVADNAESVGNRTTQAVVESIFMVIVVDAFFAVFFTAIGFG